MHTIESKRIGPEITEHDLYFGGRDLKSVLVMHRLLDTLSGAGRPNMRDRQNYSTLGFMTLVS
jgi:hypothetical protein